MIKFAAFFALAQAAGTAFLALAGYEEQGIRFGPRSLIDVLLLGGSAIAILRGHRWTTYILAASGIVDFAVKSYWFGRLPWIIPALVYCGAAIVFTKGMLRRRREQPMSSTREVARYRASWPAWVAAGSAFLQAGLYLLVLFQDVVEGRLSTGIYGLLDVVILSAFAIAVLKRHLWAAYALVGYGLCNYVVSVRRGEPWAAFFVIYLIAAWFLRKKPHVAPETIRTLRWRSIIKYAIAWFAGFEILALIFGLVRLAQGDLVRSTEVGIVHILLLVVWGVVLFGFQAWRAPAWSFETALITSIFAFSLSVLDVLVLPMTPALLLLRLLGTLAIAMLGVGCLSMLPERTKLAAKVEAQ